MTTKQVVELIFALRRLFLFFAENFRGKHFLLFGVCHPAVCSYAVPVECAHNFNLCSLYFGDTREKIATEKFEKEEQ